MFGSKELVESSRGGVLHINSSTNLLNKEPEGTILSNFPVAYLGLALGCSGCGKAWMLMLKSFEYQNDLVSGVEGAFENISLLILTVYLLKILLHPKVVRKELSNVEAHASLCAGVMSLASISSFYQIFFPKFCVVVWFLSLLIHLGLSLYHLKMRWTQFKLVRAIGKSYLEFLYPPILLPTVGIAMISATAQCFGTWEHNVGVVIFWYATVLCLLIQPFLAYRMFFVDSETINKKLLPTFFIYNAPCALLMCAYHNLGHDSKAVSLFLFSIQITCSSLFCVFSPRLFKLSFSPAWCAATFPCIVSATSFISFAIQMDGDSHAIMIFSFFFLSISSLAVVFIMILAGLWLWQSLEDKGHLPMSPLSPRAKLQMPVQPLSPRANAVPNPPSQRRFQTTKQRKMNVEMVSKKKKYVPLTSNNKAPIVI